VASCDCACSTKKVVEVPASNFFFSASSDSCANRWRRAQPRRSSGCFHVSDRVVHFYNNILFRDLRLRPPGRHPSGHVVVGTRARLPNGTVRATPTIQTGLSPLVRLSV